MLRLWAIVAFYFWIFFVVYSVNARRLLFCTSCPGIGSDELLAVHKTRKTTHFFSWVTKPRKCLLIRARWICENKKATRCFGNFTMSQKRLMDKRPTFHSNWANNRLKDRCVRFTIIYWEKLNIIYIAMFIIVYNHLLIIIVLFAINKPFILVSFHWGRRVSKTAIYPTREWTYIRFYAFPLHYLLWMRLKDKNKISNSDI